MSKSVPCRCEPRVEASAMKLACVECKAKVHAECIAGPGVKTDGLKFVCSTCVEQLRMRPTPPGAPFPCCGAAFDNPHSPCWPCRGCGQHYHALCLGVTDASAVAALQRFDAAWYCAACTRKQKLSSGSR